MELALALLILLIPFTLVVGIHRWMNRARCTCGPCEKCARCP